MTCLVRVIVSIMYDMSGKSIIVSNMYDMSGKSIIVSNMYNTRHVIHTRHWPLARYDSIVCRV